jgi:hypothetical protein
MAGKKALRILRNRREKDAEERSISKKEAVG